MKTKYTPTLALIVAGGIATGIALARPATPAAPAAPAPVVVAETAPANTGFLPDNPTVTTAPPGADPDEATATSEPIESDSGATSASVTIAGFDFGAPVTVSPGAVINVENADGAPHTLTADSGEFDTGTIAGGDTGAFNAPSSPGTYTFFCAIHPSMQGELVVQG